MKPELEALEDRTSPSLVPLVHVPNPHVPLYDARNPVDKDTGPTSSPPDWPPIFVGGYTLPHFNTPRYPIGSPQPVLRSPHWWAVLLATSPLLDSDEPAEPEELDALHNEAPTRTT